MPGDVVVSAYVEPGPPKSAKYFGRFRRPRGPADMVGILNEDFPLTVTRVPIADDFNDWSVLLSLMTSSGVVKKLFVKNDLRLTVIVRKRVNT